MAYKDIANLFPLLDEERAKRDRQAEKLYPTPPPRIAKPQPTDWEEAYGNFSVFAWTINILMIFVIYAITPVSEPYIDYIMAFAWFCYSFIFTLPYIRILTWPVFMLSTLYLTLLDRPQLITLMSDTDYVTPSIWITIFGISFVIMRGAIQGILMPILSKLGL